MSLDQELLAQIDKYKEIMQKDPNSREFLTLADLYRKLGVAEEATHILQDGLKKHPDFVDARLAIARIYLTQGQVEDATREFEQVIQQDASNFVAYKLLGEIAMQKQEHEKAAERFGAAYHLKPDDQECKVMLDYISSLLGKDVTPQLEGAPPPQQAAAPSPAPTSGETIAVTPEGEFGEFEEFEEAEELEEVGELEEEGAVFGESEEFGEIEEFGEQEDIEEVSEIEESGFSEEEIIEEEIIEEEIIEEVDETGEFEVEEMEEVEPFDVEEMAGIEEFEEGEIEAAEEEQVELLEEPVEREEELVSQIFQELSDSKYTSDEGELLDSGEGELEDLMGLLEAEEPEEIVGDLDLGRPEEEEALEEEKDLESMIDLEGVPGMEELQEEEIEDIGVIEEEVVVQEIEEFEEIEEIEEFPEEVEEIEEFGEGSAGIEELEEIEEIEEEPEGGEAEVPEIAEQEESSEESSIFQDFGLAGGEELETGELEAEELEAEELEAEELETGELEAEELEAEEEGDVFQDFDFDVFEQELLKDHPPEEIEETFEEPIAQEVETAEIVETMETLEELPEDVELEEFEEVPIEEEFEVEEGAGEEGELPTISLAELYIKQDLFDEATTIYREILRSDPSDNMIRQMLEETVALQAYVEGGE